MKLLSYLRSSFAILLAEYRTYLELSRLGDRELADIGLERRELRFVARAAAELHTVHPASSEPDRTEPSVIALGRAPDLPDMARRHAQGAT